MAELIRTNSSVRPSIWASRGRASPQASESVTGRPSTERLITTVSTDVVISVAIMVMSRDGTLLISADWAESALCLSASEPVASGLIAAGSGSR